MSQKWFDAIRDPAIPLFLDKGIWQSQTSSTERFVGEYLPTDFLAQLDQASAIGWEKAVRKGLELLAPNVAEYTEDYFFAPYRSDFVDYLPIQKNEPVVLDIGCGWGFASQRCLEKGAAVVGVEASTGRLDFCLTRFAQQGWAEHFVPLQYDVTNPLPFKLGSFDAVIVSGVLEWLGLSRDVGDPQTIQRSFLEQCHRVLKPGGMLYLAIENRYWGSYFLGARDLHTYQRLVSILPRTWARKFSKLRYQTDYRAYTYGLWDYLQFFQTLGFSRVDIYYPVPDYVQPKTVRIIMEDWLLATSQYSPVSILRFPIKTWFDCYLGRSFMFVVSK